MSQYYKLFGNEIHLLSIMHVLSDMLGMFINISWLCCTKENCNLTFNTLHNPIYYSYIPNYLGSCNYSYLYQNNWQNNKYSHQGSWNYMFNLNPSGWPSLVHCYHKSSVFQWNSHFLTNNRLHTIFLPKY